MRIRWKLLILLLVVSIGPLLAAFLFAQDATRSLGDDLAGGARDQLASDAERYLLKTVRDQARLLERGARLLEQNLLIQARAAERCLAMPAPEDARVHFCDEFERDGTVPELVESEKHKRVAGDGTPTPMAVSYAVPSFLPPPGTNERDLAAEAARLSSLTSTFKLVRESQQDLIQWQYVALANGLHCAYPGHGFYPEGYDPRRRAWYLNALATGGSTWNPPQVDASTQQIILSRSRPIRDASGGIVGVTGIDIRMTDLVREIELPSAWSDEARTMLVVPVAATETQAHKLMIIAERHFAGDYAWNVPLEPPTLASSDGEEFGQLLTDLSARRAAVRRMPFEGRDSVWAYGALPGRETALVTIVPRDLVLAPARNAESTVRLRLAQHRAIVFSIVAIVLVVVVLLSLFVSRSVTLLLSELAAAARRIADGDLDARVPVRSRDELGELGTTFNIMLPKLRERMRLRQSLSLAMEVQQHLLPQAPPSVPGLDLAGLSIYCDETGGDYYDFVELSGIGPQALGVALGDVTGHGIAAALMMATARGILRGHSNQPGGLDDLLDHLNGHLCADTPVGKFMTLAYLLFDAKANSVCWASAGHDPAIIYTLGEDRFSELAGGGIPLGIDSDWQYEEQGPRPLLPGEVIVIGTDGIWEARNPAGEMFGKDRLRDVIRGCAGQPAQRIAEAISAAVATFRAGHPQEDDITVVVIRIL